MCDFTLSTHTFCNWLSRFGYRGVRILFYSEFLFLVMNTYGWNDNRMDPKLLSYKENIIYNHLILGKWLDVDEDTQYYRNTRWCRHVLFLRVLQIELNISDDQKKVICQTIKRKNFSGSWYNKFIRITWIKS